MSLDLEALETSFDVVARGDELMDEFYKRPFEAAPAVMPLFAGTDLKRQKPCPRDFVLLRKSLRARRDRPKLRELGARHARGGARASPGGRGADRGDG